VRLATAVSLCGPAVSYSNIALRIKKQVIKRAVELRVDIVTARFMYFVIECVKCELGVFSET